VKIAVYHNLHSGGAKRALYEMTRRLAGIHHLDVYTLSTADHGFCDLRPHCSRHLVFPFSPLPPARRPFGRLNQGIRALDLFRLRALGKEIAAQIDAGGYDAVFVHHCRYGQAPALLRFLTTPSVYYCQEPPRFLYEPPVPRPYTEFSAAQRLGNHFDPLPALYRRVVRDLDRAAVLAASRVLANSAYSRESLYHIYGISARVCYLGVDTGRFRPMSLPRGDFVLSVGALNPLKGFGFLLHSLALLDASRRPPLRIVGDFAHPLERDYLEGLAARLGVTLETDLQIGDDELVQLYNQALLTLYAPIMEPFGFVPLESMACGTPVVGVREGGVRETVVHGETGLLAERDPHCFAGAVEALFRDPAGRARLGRQGRAYAERQWSWDRCVRELEEHLAAVAQRAAKSAI
jgi:glycosyltransferase involved in cell wall biosynthesis